MSETQWFADQLRLALFRPRRFAASLSREHFGLAAVAVPLAAGASLSLGLDLLVVAARDLDPLLFVPRLLTDALLVSVRAAVVVALLALAGSRALRLVRGDEAPSLAELASALGFALAPLLLVFPVGALAAIAPVLGPLAAVAVLALAARVLYGIAVGVAALLPRALAALAFVVVIVAGGYGMQDQVAHAAFVSYRHLPLLAPPLAAVPTVGTSYDRFGIALSVPERWKPADTGPGEIARFETDRDSLVATSARGSAILTPGDLADHIALDEVRGMTERTSRRDVVRIGDMIVVDDRHVGTYERRRIALRQFTTVRGMTAYALVFRSIEPDDPERSFAEDAAIAATWRITAP